jgi:hypothetical protein
MMARRPDLGKREEMWTEEDLREIMHNLSLLSEHRVREFYQRARMSFSVRPKGYERFFPKLIQTVRSTPEMLGSHQWAPCTPIR